MKLLKVKCKDVSPEEMGAKHAKMFKNNPHWVRAIRAGYTFFKAQEGTELSSSDFKKYQKAALKELK